MMRLLIPARHATMKCQPIIINVGQKHAYITNTELNPELYTNTHRGNKSAKS